MFVSFDQNKKVVLVFQQTCGPQMQRAIVGTDSVRGVWGRRMGQNILPSSQSLVDREDYSPVPALRGGSSLLQLSSPFQAEVHSPGYQ